MYRLPARVLVLFGVIGIVVEGCASKSLRLGFGSRVFVVDRRGLTVPVRVVVEVGTGFDFDLRGSSSAGVVADVGSNPESVVLPDGSACSADLLLLISFSENPLKSGLCALSYQ